MEDTDWSPSSCPVCGHYRAAARHPVCDNPKCVTHPMEGKTMTMKTEPKRYVWIRGNGDATIIDTDIVELWQDPCFSKKEDRIYELGPEVEVKVTVTVKNKTVYRENASGYRTPFENRD